VSGSSSRSLLVIIATATIFSIIAEPYKVRGGFQNKINGATQHIRINLYKINTVLKRKEGK